MAEIALTNAHSFYPTVNVDVNTQNIDKRPIVASRPLDHLQNPHFYLWITSPMANPKVLVFLGVPTMINSQLCSTNQSQKCLKAGENKCQRETNKKARLT